jgi:hypothetical protein
VTCHIPLKRSQWELQLCFKPHLNQGFEQKVMGIQSRGSLNFQNFGEFQDSNLGVPGQNDIWVQAPNPSRDESCEFVFARGSSVHQKCSNYALANLLFGLCKSMWIIDSLVTLPNPHPRAPTCPSTFEVLWAKECTQLLLFLLFSPWTPNWIYQKTWGCVKNIM